MNLYIQNIKLNLFKVKCTLHSHSLWLIHTRVKTGCHLPCDYVSGWLIRFPGDYTEFISCIMQAKPTDQKLRENIFKITHLNDIKALFATQSWQA